MTYRADPKMSIGHVHLKVADLERSIAFYRDVIGLDLMVRYGTSAAFMSAGGYHHHIGLNTWHSKGGRAAGEGFTGLYHTAFLYPDRASLGQAVAHVLDQGVTLTGSADHGVSQAVYFDDPDMNGIEMYWDRDPKDWPKDADGNVTMFNAPLDVNALVGEAMDA